MMGIAELISANVMRHPGRKALVTPDRQFTYEELWRAVGAVKGELSAQGVGSGTRVGIMLHNGAPFAVYLLAFLDLGCEVTLFNFRYRGAELARSIALTKPQLIVSSEILRPVVCQALELVSVSGDDAPAVVLAGIPDGCEGLGAQSAGHRASLISCAPQGLAWDAADPACRGVRESATALNIFTGGTTGVPKAVCHTYGGLSYQLISYLVRTPQSCRASYDVTLSSAPLFHIGGLDILLGTLACGGTLVLPAGFDVDVMIEMALRERVTSVVLIPPTLIEAFLQVRNERHERFSYIENVIVSGGACSPEIARKIFNVLPRVRVTGVYGMSEHAAALWMGFTKDEFDADSDIAALAGKANFMYDVKLVGEDGVEVAPGQVGELYGRSPCMLRGYYGGQTPFADGGYLPTGDLFSCDERGLYRFHARSKDVIKSGGENVYAVEVEDVLLAHPAVAECAVVGIPDDFYGEVVAVAVVLREGCDVDSDELVAFCKERIAGYKKPRRVLFVHELPKTSIGKVLKSEVRVLFA